MSNPYLINHISVMQQQERSEAYRCSDYMNISFTNPMCPDDRQALCNWCYKTVAACNGVSPATAIIAISYFDRFMSSNSNSAKFALADIRVGQYVGTCTLDPSIDSVYLDSFTRCSKALATLAVTRYDVTLQYPSAIAFTSICCALQLEAVPLVDSVTVLQYMISVSGLDFNDHETKRLQDTMVDIMRELFHDFPSRGHGDTAGIRSDSTQASPTSLTM
ncbi:hypothetical protein ACHAWO_006525 [Cyclotella atomus]|uniref:Cyclin N-terminal domain-containing protein n=1 Tax=Cyclotella atomus TaxID=382360 RepID=A0ABD3MW55_9STRA